jgi:HEPN domain-containing protein
MTNEGRRKYLFKVAEKKFKEMLSSYDEEDWNMVIRNAQESVECYLKGLLKFMNVEFPKEHDIGKYFEEILLRKKIEFDREKMRRVKEISEYLSKKRAPAYYGEEFYSREEAENARRDAEFVKEFAFELLKNLKG